MKITLLPILAIVCLIPSLASAQKVTWQPASTVYSTIHQPVSPGSSHSSSTIPPSISSVHSAHQWIETTDPIVRSLPARWSRSPSAARPQTLAPMLTRAPIMASPVMAAPMIMSVKGPERYNYASPTGYSPARGGFIFGRRGRR